MNKVFSRVWSRSLQALVVTSELAAARGGKAGRGHKSEIPARPFLKLTEEDEEKIIKSFNRFLSQAVG